MECLRGKPSWYLHSDVPGGAYSVPGGPPPGNWVGWHTFAVDWEPHSATFYYDGKRVGSHLYKVPHRNYMVISNAIRKDSPAVVPVDVKVDYVRVFRHSSGAGGHRLTLR
jgi:beta-glucanase (GH16 family)